MNHILSTLCIIFWGVGAVAFRTISKTCGVSGMSCNMECQEDYDCSRSGSEGYGYYHGRGDVQGCSLESINFPWNYNSTNLNLSNISLALNRIEFNVFDNVKIHILSLDLSGNVFCGDDYGSSNSYYSYSYYDRSMYSPVAGVVETFPSLRSLDLSNTVRYEYGREQHLGKMWRKKKNLSQLDISNNQQLVWVNSDDFQSMVELKELNMSQCCSSIENANASLFRDLISLQKLDISHTQWNSINQYFLFSMENLEHFSLRNLTVKQKLDFATIFRKSRVLQTVDLSSLKGSLNVSQFTFASPKIERLSMQNNLLHGFHRMSTSFGLPNPAALKELDLSNCELQDSMLGLGPFPEDLVNLEVLILRKSAGFIKRLNSAFLQNHTALKTMDLSFLEFLGFQSFSPNIFQSLLGLENLIMHQTTVRGSLFFIGRPTSSLKHFQQLIFDGNFCDEKCYLIPKIKSIDLSQSSVDQLVIHGYDDLEILKLEKAEIGDLFLSDLQNLGSLNFFAVKMGNVFLSGLKNESFSNTSNISNITKTGLNKIEGLGFTDCKIETLNLTSMNGLKFVDLSRSNVTNLILSDLEVLETLNLTFSRISKLLFLGLPALKTLDLSKSFIQDFNISELPNLQFLDISSIQRGVNFTQMRFNRFTALMELNLSFSKIYELPENCFADLKFLRSLNLSHNLLHNLPQNLFGSIDKSELRSVDLSDNYLRAVPLDNFKAIINHHSDWTIHLSRNLIDCEDCANAWLSNMTYRFNLKGALCKSPFGKYKMSVSVADICA